jgi:DNA-binding transcriptional LysR family regulator
MVVFEQVYKFWLLSLLESYQSFQEAARHAQMTQSALSQNISALEAGLEKTLVVRGRGTLHLTPAGRELLAQVQPILQDLQKIEIHGSAMKEGLKARISIGTYESVAINVLPRLLKKFRVLYPGIKMDLHTARTDILARMVRKGELDMALTINGEADKMLYATHLATDELGLYVSPDYPDANLELQNWEEWPLATIGSGPEGWPAYYVRFINSIPSKHRIVLSSDSFETIRSLTAAGSAVGLLPVRVAERRRDDLLKIWPKDEKVAKLSRHHISFITRRSGNPEISNLFKTELIDCLNF